VRAGSRDLCLLSRGITQITVVWRIERARGFSNAIGDALFDIQLGRVMGSSAQFLRAGEYQPLPSRSKLTYTNGFRSRARLSRPWLVMKPP